MLPRLAARDAVADFRRGDALGAVHLETSHCRGELAGRLIWSIPAGDQQVELAQHLGQRVRPAVVPADDPLRRIASAKKGQPNIVAVSFAAFARDVDEQTAVGRGNRECFLVRRRRRVNISTRSSNDAPE